MKGKSEYNARRIQEVCLYMDRRLRNAANYGILPDDLGFAITTRPIKSCIRNLMEKARAP